MKKKLTIVALFLLLTLVLTGCACKHEWVEATCTLPKTCQKCEEVEGEALGHTWVDADCVTPKTCSVCAATEGEALGHTWVDADCVTPKTCSVCAATEGEALGHTWVDADCVTPKTCSVCAAEGEAPGHTWVDATCEAPKTCSVCAATEGEALGHTWVDATCAAPKTCSVCAATEGEALAHTVSGWAVVDGKLAKKCDNCDYAEDTKELTLTSGVEMKAVVINDAFVMPVPAAWTTENVPEAFKTPASVYSCYDPENNYALVVESMPLLESFTTEEAYERLGIVYSNMELIKSEDGLDVLVIRDDANMLQLGLMDGDTLNVIVLLHADKTPVAGDATLDAICMDIANNLFAN